VHLPSMQVWLSRHSVQSSQALPSRGFGAHTPQANNGDAHQALLHWLLSMQPDPFASLPEISQVMPAAETHSSQLAAANASEHASKVFGVTPVPGSSDSNSA
jgi:hypothetical protein